MGKIVELITEHVISFKTVFEVLTEILDDVVMEVHNGEKKDDKFLKITMMDPSQTLVVHMKLLGKNFSTFKCKKTRFDIPLNLTQFHKLLKNVTKEESMIHIYIDRKDPQNLVFKTNNHIKKSSSLVTLKLLELTNKNYNIPPKNPQAIISMSSQEFNRICKYMGSFDDYVELQCTNGSLQFNCCGESATIKKKYVTDTNVNNDSIRIKMTNKKDIISGIFELKNLTVFSKYSNLNNNILLFMENDEPLYIKYKVPKLGEIRLCVVPIDIENTDKIDDENYIDDEEVVIKKEYKDN